ncbi:MAG: glycosyltransferase family 2 protein [Candidatus Helarchaeota archaeon]
MKVSIVIPAHNEESNLEYLIDKIKKNFRRIRHKDYEVIVVNDNSTDRTPEIIEEMHEKDNRIKPVHRNKNPGFGNAVLEGFKNVSSRSDDDIIIPMCADCSDNPNDLPRLIRASKMGYDIVYASRTKFYNYPPVKLIFRNFYNLFIKILFGFREKDITNFYKAYRYKVFKEIQRKFNLKSNDFSLTAELPIKAHLLGFSSMEIPTSWFGRAEEGMGTSSFHLRRMGIRFGIMMLKMYIAFLFVKIFRMNPNRIIQV